MSQAKVFVFDMDGVLVDSVPALFRCYLSFLEQLGAEGSQEEFDRLNGPSLEEIVASLKRRHGLKPNNAQLLSLYKLGLVQAYREVQPVEGVRQVIDYLEERGTEMAVASSASRQTITGALEATGLAGSFLAIFSADEVARAKPAPDIYMQVQEQLPDREIYVIEDAPNGVRAAVAAGLQVIHFGPDPSPGAGEGVIPARSMGEVLRVVQDLHGSAEIVGIGSSIKLLLEEDLPGEEMTGAIERLWAAERAETPSLFNGRVISYRSHASSRDRLQISCFETDYTRVLAHLRGLEAGVAPLAVSGIIVDSKGKTLIGRRGQVTEYPGWYELIPSGGLNGVSPEDQVREEFVEETGMGEGLIRTITPFCLIHDREHDVYDIGCEIRLDSAAEAKKNSEYEEVIAVSLGLLEDRMKRDLFVPSSRALFQAWRERP